jgi:6-phosphogluconolactonase/glucosamine-6-phosphate isomerase/deaminase
MFTIKYLYHHPLHGRMPLEVVIAEDFEGIGREAANIIVPELATATTREQGGFTLGLSTSPNLLSFIANLIERQGEYNPQKITIADIGALIGIHPSNLTTSGFKARQLLFHQMETPFKEILNPSALNINHGKLEAALSSATRGVELIGDSLGKVININPEICDQPYLVDIRTEVFSYIQSISTSARNGWGNDWLVTDIGKRTGQFGYHEPGMPLFYRIMLAKLSGEILAAGADVIKSGDETPKYAVTLGMGFVGENGHPGKIDASSYKRRGARNAMVLASGEGVADIVARALLDGKNPNVPMSYLQECIQLRIKKAVYVLDRAAASGVMNHQTELSDKGIQLRYSHPTSSAASPAPR